MTTVAVHSEALTALFQSAAANAAIQAARRLGVLDRLDRGPADAPQLVGECGLLNAERAGLLLSALAAVGIVEDAGDGRFHALFPNLCALTSWLDDSEALPDVLAGRSSGAGVDDPAGAALLYPAATTHLALLVASAATLAAGHLDRLLPVGGEVLDVGAGAAPWTIGLVRRRTDVRVTALDVPAVVDTTRGAVRAAGHADRFTYIAGNAFDLVLPASAFDLAVVANVCHLFDDAANELLLRRVRSSLRPGGHVVVIDVLGAEAGETPAPLVALYALGLLTRSPSGGVRAYPAVRNWLCRAGYGDVRRTNLDAVPPMSLVTGRREAER